MQSDDFVAEDVVAGRDALGDRDSPAVVVGDQLVGSPGAWGSCIVDKPTGADLEKLELRLVNVSAAPRALGQIIQNGAVMAVGPWRPLQFDDIASGNFGRGAGWSGVQMTNNVFRCVVVWVDEAIAQVLRNGPADHDRWRIHILEAWAVAFIELASDDDALHVAVSCH